MTEYLHIMELIDLMDEPYRRQCRRFITENFERFRVAWGASVNHHAWPGGLLNHMEEFMNIAVREYEADSRIRPLPFSLTDSLVTGLLHDLEKAWRYDIDDDGRRTVNPALKTKAQRAAFRLEKIAEYGICLTPQLENALKYVEGENDDYRPDGRVMGPLAAFCHCCDVKSARLWPDHPYPKGDPCTGSRRRTP